MGFARAAGGHVDMGWDGVLGAGGGGVDKDAHVCTDVRVVLSHFLSPASPQEGGESGQVWVALEREPGGQAKHGVA